MSLGFNVRAPEPIPEKMALRIMEGCLKGLGIFVSTYYRSKREYVHAYITCIAILFKKYI